MPSLVAVSRTVAPILPFLGEGMYGNLVAAQDPAAPDSVHLTAWPADELRALRDEPLEAAMATARRAVELARTLRSSAGIRVRQPLARMWLALPGGDLLERDELLALIADDVNVRDIELIDDESDLVERRVKPLLPRIGKRLGPAIPAVMAAAREGAVEFLPDGGVSLAGVTLAPDEVEILATPRPGTAVAHDEGLVVVIDTELTPELLIEGDARELQRAIQDLRRDAALEVTDRIELFVAGHAPALGPYLAGIAADTLADSVVEGPPPRACASASVDLDSGPVTIGLRRWPARGRHRSCRRRSCRHRTGRHRVTTSAGRSRPHWALFLGLAAGVVVVDQLVKAWIAADFTVGVPVQVIGDLVRITVSHNEGALFGLFQGSATGFGIVSLVVIGIIVWYEARAGSNVLVSIALGLLVGGAIGNLLDRIRLGYVDRLRRRRHRWPPLLHVQRRRRRHQLRDPPAHRAGDPADRPGSGRARVMVG